MVAKRIHVKSMKAMEVATIETPTANMSGNT